MHPSWSPVLQKPLPIVHTLEPSDTSNLPDGHALTCCCTPSPKPRKNEPQQQSPVPNLGPGGPAPSHTSSPILKAQTSNMSVCHAQGRAHSEDCVQQIKAKLGCLYVCALRNAFAKEFAEDSHTQNVQIDPASTNDKTANMTEGTDK